MERLVYFLIFALGVTLYFLLNNLNSHTVKVISMKRDTVYEYKQAKAISIHKAKMQMQKTSQANPNRATNYVARLDTIHYGDTISISYFYPENEISLNISKKIDTIPHINTHTHSTHSSSYGTNEYAADSGNTAVYASVASVLSFLFGFWINGELQE